MLTGPALGEAINEAIRLKGVPKTAVAAHFGIKAPSVHDWIKHGRIGKQHLSELVRYFADVVGPDHWGMQALSAYPAAPAPDLVEQLLTLASPRTQRVIQRIAKAAESGVLSEADVSLLGEIADRLIKPKP